MKENIVIQTEIGKVTLVPPKKKSTQKDKDDFYELIAELALKYCNEETTLN